MNSTLALIYAILPAIIVGALAYYFFSTYTKTEEKRQDFRLRKENQKQALPIRLQAFERMALFLERIDPGKLLVRIKPYNDDKFDYENLLIKTIEQEFEHNLAQQIYVSESCWNAIRATKNATIALIRKSSMSDQITSSDKLREAILTELVDKKSPSSTGLAFVKKEVENLW